MKPFIEELVLIKRFHWLDHTTLTTQILPPRASHSNVLINDSERS